MEKLSVSLCRECSFFLKYSDFYTVHQYPYSESCKPIEFSQICIENESNCCLLSISFGYQFMLSFPFSNHFLLCNVISILAMLCLHSCLFSRISMENESRLLPLMFRFRLVLVSSPCYHDHFPFRLILSYLMWNQPWRRCRPCSCFSFPGSAWKTKADCCR